MVGVVLETGHAHLSSWDSNQLIRKLKNKLLALHLNDTSGRVDNHLLLKKGAVNWESIFHELRCSKSLPELGLEVNTQIDNLTAVVHYM